MSHSKHIGKNILELLAILRSENPTQYCTLIKMHLSFVTDLSTDQCDGSFDSSGIISSSKSILSPLMKKFLRGNYTQQNVGKAMLTYDVVNQLFQLISFLKKYESITQEGLFRKTGSVTRQAELKSSLLEGRNLNLESANYSAHDCASVLKSFLSDLPEPILQEGEYHVHCRIAELCRKKLTNEKESVTLTRQVKALSLVFLLLPAINYELLRELLMLLHEVTLHQDKNKMSSLNLGTMFAPHILCPRKMSPNELQNQSGSLSSTVAFIIENAKQLFQIPSELAIDVREYFRTENMERQLSKRSMEDAATKTSMTFIDRELTAEANGEDVTVMALADLYAHVQSLPNSSAKKKLISKFNDVSGPGTPKYNQSFQKKDLRVKSFGDSIKKHLFNRSIKKSKNKNTSLTNSLSIKRSKSDDYLSTSIFCSPDLGSPKSSKIKTKSLENLLSPKLSSIINRLTSNGTKTNNNENASADNVAHPSTPKVNISRSQSEDSARNKGCPSFSTPVRKDAASLVALRLSHKAKLNSLALPGQKDSDPQYEANMTPYRCSNSNSVAFSIGNKEEIISPISRALRNTVDHQKLMLTPRSRCPIIVKSTSSLSSVVIQEELSEKEQKFEGLANDESTDKSQCHSPLSDLSFIRAENESDSYSPHVHNVSVGLRDFYRHLSPPTLEKLADNLKSPKSESNLNKSRFNSNANIFNCHNTSHNETLSTVFKDYLLSRGILAENSTNASNLSLEGNVNKSQEDDGGQKSVKEQSHCITSHHNVEKERLGFDEYRSELSECNDSVQSNLKEYPECDDSLKNDLKGIAEVQELSTSLQLCLDGHNPLHFSSTPKRSSLSPEYTPRSSLYTKKAKVLIQNKEPKGTKQKNPKNKVSKCTSFDQTESITICDKACDDSNRNNLHTCSPNGRSSSILKNKNGTPVRGKVKESKGTGNSVNSILFETEF